MIEANPPLRSAVIDARAQLRRALGWYGSATLLMRVVDVASTIVVLHYLSKDDLGLASLCLGITITAEALSGFGVSGAIVQAEHVSAPQQSSLFWWCMAVALVLAMIVWLGADPIARYYEAPRLGPMVAVSGLKLLTVGAAIVPLHMLSRALRFKQVSVVQASASLAETVTKLSLAVIGFGAWALVVSNVLRGLFLLLALLIVVRFVPKLRFRRNEIAPFVSFGVRASLASLVSEAARNVDYFLIGKYLGVSTLGVYRVAFDVAMTPAEAIAQPISRVSVPLFSRLALEPQRMPDAFLRSTRYLLALTGPVALFLSFAGEDLLTLIQAGAWLEAMPALGVLCWAAVMRVMTRMFSNVFVACGRPDLALLEAGLTLMVLAASMIALLQLGAAQLGMLAVCYAWLLAYPILFSVLWRFARQVMELRLETYARALAPIIAGLIVTAGTTATALAMLAELHPSASAITRLACVAAVVLATFTAFMRWGLRPRAGDLRPSTPRSADPQRL